jgi:hypothetical protein
MPEAVASRGLRKRDAVDVAPHPIFAGLEGADDGMAALFEVFGGMFFRRIVAAAYVPAGHAEAEVNPVGAPGKAFLAAFGSAGDNVFDLVLV